MSTAKDFDDPKFDSAVKLMLDQHLDTLGQLLGHLQANALASIIASGPSDTEIREQNYYKIQAVAELDLFIRNCASRHDERIKAANKGSKE